MTELTLARLMALEDEGWRSLTGSTGGDFYGDLMTADAVMVLVNGMVVYRARATRDGQPEPFVALMSSVYRLVDGRPRLALYQQTTITH